MRMGIARALGQFAATWPSEELPAVAIERAKMSLSSTLASAAIGCRIDSVRAVRQAELEASGSLLSQAPGLAELWFLGQRLPAERAARINAMASDAAASDDSDLRSIAHIGTIVSAVGLAVGSVRGCSGSDILSAMVVGYEVAGRVDEALTPGRMQRGFHGSVSTVFGSAVACGRLMQLDAERMAHALALTASSACGMAIAADTSCAREYHAGLAAQLGIQAAQAARHGFRAELDVMEAPRGFFDAFNGQDLGAVSQGLGESWDIVTDMAIKLMPGAHPFHALAEAAAQARAQHGVVPHEVQRVVISAPQLATWAAQAVAPTDLVGAAHSVPYFVAVALVDGQVGWDLFEPHKMQDPRILQLLQRVVFDPDPPPHPDRFGHRHGGTLHFEMRDGTRRSVTCRAPRGSGARGIEWADVDAKYNSLLERAGVATPTRQCSLDALHAFQNAGSPEVLLASLRASLGDPAPAASHSH